MVKPVYVDLYKWHEKGSLNMCIEIAKIGDTVYDASGWGTPFRFYPKTAEERAEILKWIGEYRLTLIDETPSNLVHEAKRYEEQFNAGI